MIRGMIRQAQGVVKYAQGDKTHCVTCQRLEGKWVRFKYASQNRWQNMFSGGKRQSTVQVPFMVTRATKQTLLDNGFTLAQIKQMPPVVAIQLAESDLSAGSHEAEKIFSHVQDGAGSDWKIKAQSGAGTSGIIDSLDGVQARVAELTSTTERINDEAKGDEGSNGHSTNSNNKHGNEEKSAEALVGVDTDSDGNSDDRDKHIDRHHDQQPSSDTTIIVDCRNNSNHDYAGPLSIVVKEDNLDR